MTTVRVDALAALHAAIVGARLDAAARRRLLVRIDATRQAGRITALEARSLREAVNGHSTQRRD
jgi:hypothetical protein